jgi:hypothetical protein
MSEIEVKSGSYKVVNQQDDLVLYTCKLEREIAIAVFSNSLKKVGLARNLNQEQLLNFFLEINPDNLPEVGSVSVNIIGGNESLESLNALKALLEQLEVIDKQKNIINIRSCDTCDRVHPDSFLVDCYHGGIRAIAV